jgi:hypothetical protein
MSLPHNHPAAIIDFMAKTLATTGKSLLTKDDRAYLARFRRAANRYKKAATQSPETALKALIDLGLYGNDGKPSKQYRKSA